MNEQVQRLIALGESRLEYRRNESERARKNAINAFAQCRGDETLQARLIDALVCEKQESTLQDFISDMHALVERDAALAAAKVKHEAAANG